jgi:2-(1,2-epoxy-1,2-dihydrophenyl)acetyl-CoA isomerase
MDFPVLNQSRKSNPASGEDRHSARKRNPNIEGERSMPDILTHIENRVATITLNRPEKLNALSRDLIAQSTALLRDWSRDPEIGAIVLTGAGRAFCAGGDVSSMAREGDAAETLEQQVDGLRQAQELSWLLYNIPKITIAAVNGFAMGAGLGICLSCDLRIASEQAKFGTAYAKVGFGGDFGTTWLLARYVGAPKAKELFFLADILDAAEAHRLGLVNRIAPHDDLTSQVTEIAARIAHGPLTSYRYMKANVNLAQSTDFRTLLDREAETHLRCGMTEDHKEGVRAFLEKRAPKFTGK